MANLPTCSTSDPWWTQTVPLSTVYGAAVDFHAAVVAVFDAALAADAVAAAMLGVRHRLDSMGVVGPLATNLMASSVDDLRSVATEVLGDGYTAAAWDALLLTYHL